MRSPKLPLSHPDRNIDCQQALEPEIHAVVDEGLAAGWTALEIAHAVGALMDNYVLGMAANEDTDRQISEALSRLGQ